MTKAGHLWAIGYDDMGRAEEIRQEIVKLGDERCLILQDTAVAVRYPDGVVTLEGEPFMAAIDFCGHPFARCLAGLALGAPALTKAAAGLLVRSTGGAAAQVGIDDAFVGEVQAMMKPGTSALFVLDQECDMEAILQGIRGLGGTVLKTNVDMERANLIQATLASVQ
jgi:uncharacterized membrane protein